MSSSSVAAAADRSPPAAASSSSSSAAYSQPLAADDAHAADGRADMHENGGDASVRQDVAMQTESKHDDDAQAQSGTATPAGKRRRVEPSSDASAAVTSVVAVAAPQLLIPAASASPASSAVSAALTLHPPAPSVTADSAAAASADSSAVAPARIDDEAALPASKRRRNGSSFAASAASAGLLDVPQTFSFSPSSSSSTASASTDALYVAARPATSLSQLAVVEIQLIMRCLNLQSLLVLGRCSQFMHRCAAADFARQLLPPIELHSRDAFVEAHWSDAVVRSVGVDLHWMLSEVNDLSRCLRNVSMLPPLRALTLSSTADGYEEIPLTNTDAASMLLVTLVHAGHLASITSLRSVNLDVYDGGAAFIPLLVEQCPRLCSFAQEYGQIRYDDVRMLLESLERCPHLTSLSLTLFTNCMDLMAPFLGRVGLRLSELALGINCEGDTLQGLLRSLQACTSLTRLELSELRMHSEHSLLLAAALEHMPLLSNLKLAYCKFQGDALVTFLQQLIDVAPRLASLNLNGYGVPGDAASQALRDVLQRAISLTELSLQHHSLDDTAFATVLAVLAANPQMRTLNIARTVIEDVSLEALVLVMENSRSLFTLEVNKCGLRNSGAMALALAMHSHFSCLARLDIADNGITTSGAIAIAKALYAGAPLQYLRLSDNRIGDEGGIALAAAMRQSRTLETLEMSDCGVKDAGIVDLSLALPASSLTCLEIFDNSFGKDGGLALSVAVLNSPRLRRLGISNDVAVADPDARKMLLLALTLRPHIKHRALFSNDHMFNQAFQLKPM